MKQLKNNSRRLIEINGRQKLIKDAGGNVMQAMSGDKVQLIPGTGNWIDVSDEIAASKYVAILVKEGDIEEREAEKSAEDVSEYANMTKAELLECATTLEIEGVSASDTKADIIEAIEAAE